MCSKEDTCGFNNDPNFIVNDRHVKIRLEVEGYRKHDIKITTRGNSIHVHGRREEDKKDEIVTKNFNTSYDIPPGYALSKISARLEDGKLNIEVPVENRDDSVSRDVEIH